MTEPKYGDALTSKQREIFDFIETFQREKGCKPSLKQIAEYAGRSRATIREHLEKLSDMGAVRRSNESNAFKINDQFSKGVYVKVVSA
jgi:SOS-response transcriptional repressor LexA